MKLHYWYIVQAVNRSHRIDSTVTTILRPCKRGIGEGLVSYHMGAMGIPFHLAPNLQPLATTLTHHLATVICFDFPLIVFLFGVVYSILYRNKLFNVVERLIRYTSWDIGWSCSWKWNRGTIPEQQYLVLWDWKLKTLEILP